VIPLSDQKIIVSAAPISGPDEKSSYTKGLQAGQEDREAGLFAADQDKKVPHADIRRIIEQYRAHQAVVGALILRDREGAIASAKTAHEQAGHRLKEAEAKHSETGQAVWASVAERAATADQITNLVNPELVRHRHGTVPEDNPGAENPPRAFRHILDRKMSRGWGFTVLIALAAAEGFLNIQAFAATGESSYASFVLAVLVGISIVGLAHRIGGGAADLLENLPKARGRSPARIAEVLLGVPALIIGILGTAAIRASYFAAQNRANPSTHIRIPTPGLVALAFMLAAAAIAVSMAMHNPFADNLDRQDLAIADHRHAHEEARQDLLDAQNEVSETASVLWGLFKALVNAYDIQSGYVKNCTEAYLDGYCKGAGVCVDTESLPDSEPQFVKEARTWLAANPVGTLAPPTLPYSSAGQTGLSRQELDRQELDRQELDRQELDRQDLDRQETTQQVVASSQHGIAAGPYEEPPSDVPYRSNGRPEETLSR
jgi:hypothetical protein